MKKKIWAIATVFILIFTGLSESSISHASPKKSKSYQLGWNAVYKTPRPTLDNMGLEKIFDLEQKNLALEHLLDSQEKKVRRKKKKTVTQTFLKY